MKDLIVGDLHVQPGNLAETEKLFAFIREQFVVNNANNLILLGDVFHTHSVIRQEVAYLVLDFIRSFYYEVVSTNKARIVIIAGNHDGISPTTTDKNALQLILSEYATVISGDQHLIMVQNGYVCVPFMYNNDLFVEKVNQLSSAASLMGISNPTLICHQTFDGAAYESGMPCPGGVRSEDVSYSVIISGHIHKRQIVRDKVIYLGTPRAVTAAESNDEKFIYLVGRNEEYKVSFTPISTKHVVKNYIVFVVDELDSSTHNPNLQELDLTKDDVRVKVSGTQVFYDTVLDKYRQYLGNIKFIPLIKKDLSKRVSLEHSGVNIESALESYVYSIADIETDIKDDVWKIMSQMLTQ